MGENLCFQTNANKKPIQKFVEVSLSKLLPQEKIHNLEFGKNPSVRGSCLEKTIQNLCVKLAPSRV